jgi:hypothetical protein
MNTITETAPQTDDLQVRTDPAGKPLAIRHNGRIWLVDPATEATHWFGRDTLRDGRRTATVGSGDLVSIEYWRIQVRLGTSDSAVRTFTLRRDPLAAQWSVDSIDDGS